MESLFLKLAATPFVTSTGIWSGEREGRSRHALITLNCSFKKKFSCTNVSPVSHTVAPPSDTFNIFWYLFSSVDFVWKAGVTVPQNSYKPSKDLWEATLYGRTQSIQRSNTHIATKTSCYFYIRIFNKLNPCQWRVWPPNVSLSTKQ